jgi:hypothetical protein
MDILLPSEKHNNISIIFVLDSFTFGGVGGGGGGMYELYFFVDNGLIEKTRCLIIKQTDKSQ